MDELTKLVMQKTGLSADQAKAAVDTVVGFLKSRLPAPIAGEIDSALGGNMQGAEGIEGQATKVLGSFFEKK